MNIYTTSETFSSHNNEMIFHGHDGGICRPANLQYPVGSAGEMEGGPNDSANSDIRLLTVVSSPPVTISCVPSISSLLPTLFSTVSCLFVLRSVYSIAIHLTCSLSYLYCLFSYAAILLTLPLIVMPSDSDSSASISPNWIHVELLFTVRSPL